MSLYDAFISYSHAKDKPTGAALQSAMQKLGKAWYRRRKAQRRTCPAPNHLARRVIAV